MYDLPDHTLAPYLLNPLFTKTDLSELPIADLASELVAFQHSHATQVSPEADALQFYFFNHAFHLIQAKYAPLARLPDDLAQVVENHFQATNTIAKRLLFYNLLIAVEEARFIPAQDETFHSHMNNSFGPELMDFITKRSGNLAGFGKLPLTCGDYTRGIMSVFAFGKWQPGYGGHGWVPIATVVHDFISGNLSLEQLADQSFSLCHNNGSMFNKGHFYVGYSEFIYQVLDIQDSGQIPQWLGKNLSSSFVTPTLRESYQIMAKHFPEAMTGKLDQSLLRDSAAKRTKKAAILAKKNSSTWNSGATAIPKAKPVQKIDNMLVDMFKKGMF